MRGGGALTLSVFDVDLTSVGGVVSVGVHILLWVQVAGPSSMDVTTMLMEALEVTGVSLTSTNHDRQSASLLCKGMIWLAGSLSISGAVTRRHWLQFTSDLLIFQLMLVPSWLLQSYASCLMPCLAS